MINFCCVLYGTKYKPIYVQNLYNMVTRNLSVPHKFYCFTDNIKLDKILEGDIIVRQFPLHDMQGWWNKMQLFHPDNELSGVNLYMDLDVVIMRNIDCFAEYDNDTTFSITSDFNGRKIWYNSSLMKWHSETMKPIIWDEFIKDRSYWYRLQGDQNAITALTTDIVEDMPNLKVKPKDKVKPYPDDWTFSYKWHDRKDPRFDRGRWDFSRGEGSIAVFHGKPNPHEADQDWVKNNWK